MSKQERRKGKGSIAAGWRHHSRLRTEAGSLSSPAGSLADCYGACHCSQRGVRRLHGIQQGRRINHWNTHEPDRPPATTDRTDITAVVKVATFFLTERTIIYAIKANCQLRELREWAVDATGINGIFSAWSLLHIYTGAAYACSCLAEPRCSTGLGLGHNLGR